MRARALLRRFASTASALLHQPSFVAGLVLLAVLSLLALSPDLAMEHLWNGRRQIYNPVTGYDPDIIHPSGPSGAHLLGTDPLGRDVLSTVMHALGDTLLVAVAAAAVVAVLATAVGVFSAFLSGWSDASVGRLVDMILLLPPPIALIVVNLARPEPLGSLTFGLVYGALAGLGGAAIVSRAHARTIIVRPFIHAARIAGAGRVRIAAVHLMPHLVPLVGAQMMLAATGAVTTDAFVEFFATNPGQAEIGLGTLIYYGLTYQAGLATDIAWSALLAGSLFITALAASFYLISVGLREHLAVDQRTLADA